MKVTVEYSDGSKETLIHYDCYNVASARAEVSRQVGRMLRKGRNGIITFETPIVKGDFFKGKKKSRVVVVVQA